MILRKKELLKIEDPCLLLHSLSQTYLKNGAFKNALNITVQKTKEFYRSDFATIFLSEEDGKNLTIEADYGRKNNRTHIKIPINSGTPEGFVFLNKQSAVITDITKESRFKIAEPIRKDGVKSGIWAPMIVDNHQALGVISVCYKKTIDVPAFVVWFLETIANSLAVYIKKEKTLQEAMQTNTFLTSVLEGMGEGVVVVDRDFKILRANKSYCTKVKMSCSEIVGRYCYEISHHLSKPCYEAGEECPVKAAFETGYSRRVVHTHLDKENKPTYLEIISYPLKNMAGNITSAIEVFTDVTERVALEEELNKKIKDLEEFYDMAVDRELKMIELKEEIQRLREELENLKKEKQ